VFEQISNHAEQGLARLISQYKGKPVLADLITTLIEPLQDIEDTLVQLNTLRQLSTAAGKNLDEIGTIVGLVRPAGDDDTTYRQKIIAQIKINTSHGQPEQAIQVFQLFTGANIVLLSEFYPGEIIIGSDHIFPDTQSIDLIISIVQKVVPAGVRVNGVISFEGLSPFAYAGGTIKSGGYGSVSAPGVGGGYGSIRVQQ